MSKNEKIFFDERFKRQKSEQSTDKVCLNNVKKANFYSIPLLLSRKGVWGEPLFGIQRVVSPTKILQ